MYSYLNLTTFDIADVFLNNFQVEYNSIQELIKSEYLFALKQNKEEIEKLKFSDYQAAIFNSILDMKILTVILDNIDNLDYVIGIMEEETKRIMDVTEGYSDSEVEVMSRKKFESILGKYLESKKVENITDYVYRGIDDIKTYKKVISMEEYKNRRNRKNVKNR